MRNPDTEIKGPEKRLRFTIMWSLIPIFHRIEMCLVGAPSLNAAKIGFKVTKEGEEIRN